MTEPDEYTFVGIQLEIGNAIESYSLRGLSKEDNQRLRDVLHHWLLQFAHAYADAHLKGDKS